MLQLSLIIIFSLLLLPGIICTLIPVIPALPYMFLVAVIYGFIDKFIHLTSYEITVLGIITLVSVIVDWASGIVGAKYGGASVKSLIIGTLGFLIGLVLIPPFGGFLGLFAGIFISEVLMFQDHKKALKSASGGLIGTLLGMVINLVISVAFLLMFISFTTN